MSKLETNQVDPSTGTTLTLGTSGDTIAIPSGVTIANSGTATGFGGDNTPAFSVKQSSAQTGIANTTQTLVTFDTEEFDTDNTFSAGRFTPGVAGKYFIAGNVNVTNGTDGTVKIAVMRVYKNGSQLTGSDLRVDFRGNPGRGASLSLTAVVSLSATDYIEFYAANNATGGSANIESYGSRIGGYRILE